MTTPRQYADPSYVHGRFRKRIVSALTDALLTLLEERHLYQPIRVAFPSADDAKREAEKLSPVEAQSFVMRQHAFQRSLWEPNSYDRLSQRMVFDHGGSPPPDTLTFDLPTARCYCQTCESREAFNPFMRTGTRFDRAFDFVDQLETSPPAITTERYYRQVFVLPYQCQRCKSTPDVFVIARTQEDLTSDTLVLMGRYPIEHAEVPPAIPIVARKHFSKAVYAFQANQVLPAIFMLRVTIEQFAKAKVQAPLADKRGDTLMAAYSQTLDSVVRSGFPLGPIYEILSEAMHDANASPEVFNEARDKIVRHFEARRLHMAGLQF